MNILVGYIPSPEGLAAVDWAIAEAQEHRASLFVLNTGKDGNYADPQFATAEDIDALDAQLERVRPDAHDAPPDRRRRRRRQPADRRRPRTTPT